MAEVEAIETALAKASTEGEIAIATPSALADQPACSVNCFEACQHIAF
jgi:hypothetical protein